MLNASELERYSRQILLDEIGEAGQRALKAARVLIVGVGGLGSPVATYLAAAGVGTIGLVDDDVIELSNLHRQILFSQAELGEDKVVAGARRLSLGNDNINVLTHHERLSAVSAEALISDYDIVVDCSDNFASRYAINDACLLLGRPFVYGSIYRFEGQVSVFCHAGGPCYRCLFPEENAVVANCAEAGVVGVLAGVIGSLQATEVLKLILGIGESLAGRLLLYDALALDFRVLKLTASCSLFCSTSDLVIPENDSVLEPDQDYSSSTPLAKDSIEACQTPPASTLSSTSVSASVSPSASISPAQLRRRLDSEEKLQLLDVRTVQENRAMRFRSSKLIAVDELETRYSEVSSRLPVVVYCRSGVRSRRAVRLLRSKGYDDVLNLSGGILAWYREFQDYLLEHDLSSV
jgi:molybdopterin/thiamine biosynthesis adenylyltransferase/rhodanese-related sulfurtransferase